MKRGLIAPVVFLLSCLLFSAGADSNDDEAGYWKYSRAEIVRFIEDYSGPDGYNRYAIFEGGSSWEGGGAGGFQKNETRWQIPGVIVPGQEFVFTGDARVTLGGDYIGAGIVVPVGLRLDFFPRAEKTLQGEYKAVDRSAALQLFSALVPEGGGIDGSSFSQSFRHPITVLTPDYRGKSIAVLQVTDILVGCVVYIYTWETGTPPAGAAGSVTPIVAVIASVAIGLAVLLPQALSGLPGIKPAAPGVKTEPAPGAKAAAGDIAGKAPSKEAPQPPPETAQASQTATEALARIEKQNLIRKKVILENIKSAHQVQGEANASAEYYDAALKTAEKTLALANAGVDLIEGALKASGNKILSLQADVVKNGYLFCREFLPEAVQAVHEPAEAAGRLIKGAVKGVREMLFNWGADKMMTTAGGEALKAITEPETVTSLTRSAAGMLNAHVGRHAGDIISAGKQALAGQIENVLKDTGTGTNAGSFLKTAGTAVVNFLSW